LIKKIIFQPNYDVEMDLLGWLEDEKLELLYHGNDAKGNPIYTDDRELKKYYKKDKSTGKYVHKSFTPLY